MKLTAEQRFIEAGSKIPTKTEMPKACAHCSGATLKRRVAAYPVILKQPEKLAGKRIDVYRVALHECQDCGKLMPTAAGQAKVERCLQRGIEMFLEAPR
jgi:hypothetical protein